MNGSNTNHSDRCSLLAAGCLTAAVVAAGCGPLAARSVVSGSQLYASCAPCHGDLGEGNPALGAPSIAGLPTWYVTEQLRRFKDGLRGKHPDDTGGLRMRAMARQMMSTTEVEAVAGHVSGLPVVKHAATLHGADMAAGQPLYGLCAVCHGAQAEGNQTLNAPPLAHLDDWYVAAQVKKYQSGIRGTAPDDALGPAMQAIANSVEPAAVDHLAAYILTLSK